MSSRRGSDALRGPLSFFSPRKNCARENCSRIIQLGLLWCSVPRSRRDSGCCCLLWLLLAWMLSQPQRGKSPHQSGRKLTHPPPPPHRFLSTDLLGGPGGCFDIILHVCLAGLTWGCRPSKAIVSPNLSCILTKKHRNITWGLENVVFACWWI